MIEIPTGPWHTADELLEIYTSIYRQILPPAIFEQFLKMVEEGEGR